MLYSIGLGITYFIFLCKFLDFLFCSYSDEDRYNTTMYVLFISSIITMFIAYHIKKKQVKNGLYLGSSLSILFYFVNNYNTHHTLLLSGVAFGSMFLLANSR